MARFSYHIRSDFPFWTAAIDDHKTLTFEVSFKRFLFKRRAVRWARDERHRLERDAWARQMAALTNGTNGTSVAA